MAARPPRPPSPDSPRTGAAKSKHRPKGAGAPVDLNAALLAAIVGAAHDAILICDAQERLVVFNQAAERMFGCSAEEAIGAPLDRFVPERFRAGHSHRLRGLAAKSTAGPLSGEHAQVFGLRADGTEIPLEAAISAVAVGDQTYYAVIHRDSSERLATESATRERLELQDRLTELSAVAPGAMFSYEMHADGRQGFTFLSEGVRVLVGLSPQEVLAAPGGYFGFVHPDDLAETLGGIETSARGAAPWRAEFRVRHASGEWVWIEGRSAPEPPRADGALVFHGFLSDITERKRAEAALVASERRYRGLFETLLEGYAYCRMIFEGGRAVDWVHLDVNPAFEALTGLQGAAGRRVTELVPGILEANPELFEAYGQVVATGVPTRFETYVPGLERWYSISSFRPEPGCFAVVFQDITERKRSEAALRANEERLRLALEGAQQGLFDLDVQTGDAAVSPEYALMLGYDPEGFRETNAAWIERLHPDDRPAVSAAYLDYIAGRSPEYRVEFRQRTQSGEWKWILSLGKVVERDAAGRPLRMLGTHTDITARKAAEVALAHERSRLRTVLDTIPDPVWLKDPEGAYLNVNPAFERLMGRAEAELVGHTDFDFFDRERAESFRVRDWNAVIADRPTTHEEPVVFADDGHAALFETIKTPVRDAAGRLIGVLSVARDVSAARAAAEALRRSEERLRLFIEQAPAALAMFDREMRYLSASRRWRSDFELGEVDLTGRLHYETSPEVRADWKAAHLRGLAGEVVRAEEDRFVRPNGEVQWLRWEVRPWRDDSGAVAGVVIFTEDITESKRAVEALAESEAHFRALAETTFDCIWEVDEQTRYTFISPRIRDLLGYEPEELIGRTPYSLMPDEEAERVLRSFDETATRRLPFAALENVNRHRDGRLVVLESSGVPFFAADGEFLGYRGMDRDVTARRQAERRSATQAAVSRVLAESSSLTSAAPRVLEAIGRSEGWEFGALWEADLERDALRCVDHWSAGTIDTAALAARTRSMALARGEGFPGQVQTGARPVLNPDLLADARFPRRAVATELGLQSIIGFPILLEDRVVGVVEFFGRQIHEPEPGLLEMFDAIGRQLGQSVERWRAEEAVQRFVSGSPAVIYAMRIEPAGPRLVWRGGNLQTVSGWSGADAIGAHDWMDNVHPDDRERVLASNAVPYEIDYQALEFRFRRPDGGYFWVRDEKRLLRDPEGRPAEIVGSWTDVTARVQLEEQLRVSQKLEAIGRLAGGVAHDFNNILTVISGNGELLARSLAPGGADQMLLGEIRDASERAAALTRQLLAFSRSQVLAPRVVDLNAAVGRVEGMLRRLIGEDIELVCVLAPEVGHVRVDPGQFEQVLLNLAVNARDAMPRGGKLTLESHLVELDAADCRGHAEVGPGRYAQLAVSDNGSGMTPEVRERIFEPFFTTKAAGAGTGLGLSTVFGIVKQSAGHIEVESEVGLGSCFRIYLPQVEAPADVVATASATAVAPRGHETILLVEDEEGVRRIARIALESRGYRVLGAAEGRAALAVAEEHGEGIDLLVTDLVMPGMSGRELADALRVHRPGLRVLFMSGYVEDALVHHGIVEAEVAFLHKPFSLVDLAAKVREVLDAADGSAAPLG